MQIMTLIDPIFSALAGFIQKFATAILAMLVGTGSFMAPPTDDPIKAVNPDEVQLTFNVSGDSQVNGFTYNRVYLDLMLQDINNAETEQDAFVVVGDITENSLPEEWDDIKTNLLKYDFGDDLIFATGNHDIRLRNYKNSLKSFAQLNNSLNGDNAVDSYYFSQRVNGYKVIVLGSDKTEMEQFYLGDAQLEWLDDEVKAENGKPTIVVLHHTLKDTHNEKNAFGSITGAGGSVGDQSIVIKKILSKYKNVFLITGHLHSGFGPDSYNNVDGIHSINVPSMTIENKDGTYNDAGTGYIMEIYKTKVIFRARDFAKGTWVAETTGDSSYDITIKIEK